MGEDAKNEKPEENSLKRHENALEADHADENVVANARVNMENGKNEPNDEPNAIKKRSMKRNAPL